MSRRLLAGATLLSSPLLASGALAVLNDDIPEHLISLKSLVSATPPSQTPAPHLVILGTGWGSMSLLSRLAVAPTSCRVTVISPRPHFFYTPLLAGTSTGTVRTASISEPIRRHLAPFLPPAQGQPRFVQANSTDVDFAAQEVSAIGPDGTPIQVSYDHLVVAVGADVNTFNIPGIHEHAVFMKELEDGMKLQRKLHDQLEKASAMLAAGASKEEVAKLLHFVVVGGGPTGVELTAELGDFLRDDVEKAFPAVSGLSKVTLVEAGPKILATFDPHISEYAKGRLEAHGASVQTGTMVRRATESSLLVAKKGEPDASIDYGVLVWAGGVKARGFTEKMAGKIGGVQTPANRPIRGLAVGPDFAVTGVSNVYAIGDCALAKGCSPTAQAAFQQGKWLGRALRDHGFSPAAAHKNGDPFVFANQGSLAYIGASEGVAELKNVLWDNHPEWGGGESGGGDAVVEGKGAFAIWRSLYFSKLLSGRNKWMVGMDWLNVWAGGGREVSTPYVLHAENGGNGKVEERAAEGGGGGGGVLMASAVGGVVGLAVGGVAATMKGTKR